MIKPPPTQVIHCSAGESILNSLLVTGVLPLLLASSAASQDCRDRYRQELDKSPESSLVHFRIAECYRETKDRVSAVNEFRLALSADCKPAWSVVWSHLNMGKIFDSTGQRRRALGEYRLAEKTGDNTRGAQQQVAKYLETPYKEP